jgi:hypothetical protein
MNRFFLILICVFSLCACASNRPAGRVESRPGESLVSKSEPVRFEKNLRWKDWVVLVNVLSIHTGDMQWYEVRCDRVVQGKRETQYQTTYDAEGTIQAAWLGEFRGAGVPVLALSFMDRGSAHYGSLKLFECREKGFRAIEGPSTARPLLEGYRGGDIWEFKEGVFFRTFPIYKEGDETRNPTGGQRVIRYHWENGKWRARYHQVPGTEVIQPTPFVGKSVPTK